MNFFAYQEQARRQSHRLVGLFALAVLAIVAVLNGVLLLVLRVQAEPVEPWGAMALLTVGTLVLIGGASLFRIASLRGGGATVARAMGATPVPADTRDPSWRRLRNVVEEIAIASGVPVPQVYVMAHEQGINAFAAGYAPSDAVVAVTQGCLDRLSRDELQGVIAHEFSHVRNGDMRLNIRLMGVLFGILVLGVLGRMVLRGSLRGGMRAGSRSGGSRNGGGQGAIIAIGLALLVLGYVGVFFGRLIKAGVSRQREYLADASAVQFTRQPAGLAGALKKIGALGMGSRLEAPDTEEVSHMLFASGHSSFSRWLATHPPLEQRIRAIEPGFDPREFERVARELAGVGAAASGPEAARVHAGTSAGPTATAPHAAEPTVDTAETAGASGETGAGLAGSPLGALAQALPAGWVTAAVLADMAQPDARQLATASRLLQELPPALYEAAHVPDAAAALVLALLLGRDPDVQFHRHGRLRPVPSADQVGPLRQWLPEVAALSTPLRLPLMQLCLPALHALPAGAREALARQVQSLAALAIPARSALYAPAPLAEGERAALSLPEQVLAYLLRTQLRDTLQPSRAHPGGPLAPAGAAHAVHDLLATLASHGHADAASARAALAEGWAAWVEAASPGEQRLAGEDTMASPAGTEADRAAAAASVTQPWPDTGAGAGESAPAAAAAGAGAGAGAEPGQGQVRPRLAQPALGSGAPLRAPDARALLDALRTLDNLALTAQPRLVAAMVATVSHDGVVTADEAELLRALCACLHVPVPVLARAAPASSPDPRPAVGEAAAPAERALD